MSKRPELCRRTLRTKASVSASTLRVFAAGMERGSCLHWWIYWVPSMRGGPRSSAWCAVALVRVRASGTAWSRDGLRTARQPRGVSSPLCAVTLRGIGKARRNLIRGAVIAYGLRGDLGILPATAGGLRYRLRGDLGILPATSCILRYGLRGDPGILPAA